MGFGPKVIGDEAYALQQRRERIGANKFGEKVLVPDPVPSRNNDDPTRPSVPIPGLETPEEEFNEELLTLTVEEVGEFLAADAQMFPDLVRAEMNRPGGPRLDALRILEKHEATKPKPDPRMLALLNLPLNVERRRQEAEARREGYAERREEWIEEHVGPPVEPVVPEAEQAGAAATADEEDETEE